MKTVPLHGKKAAGRVALVDDEDYELVSRYRWHIYDREPERPGWSRKVYATANAKTADGRRTTLKMHVLIMGHPHIDHRNRNGLDNQRKNLRPATKAENARNLPATRRGRSRYKGVGFHSLNGRWRARIKTDTGSISLGVYATEEEAARAYDAAARVYHGEFAYLNFPGG
jgi:hypothetical protein